MLKNYNIIVMLFKKMNAYLSIYFTGKVLKTSFDTLRSFFLIWLVALALPLLLCCCCHFYPALCPVWPWLIQWSNVI